ncbi:hypothetical protein DFP72DRAFT_821354 [Ephemerocybe angulata]|uniref:Uncharacterized protein n=1 Tax=Ephemerocybe angulata TaxID=980116 RepID=A0A8H6LXK9_9AGAR|nr:hypothetical protein DFP72DRAFT_821354 [Tulosesus angulatus]
MSTGDCIPGNPDIAGVGVRIAIYVQTLLCFFPAFWALFDGKVSQGELDAAENQATTNLVLAFAILISSIVQAQTLGLTNYHASIVLNMSWLNNTNTFIYFLLYIQHKSQAGVRGRVSPTWRAWAQHVRELVVSVVYRGEYRTYKPVNCRVSTLLRQVLRRQIRQALAPTLNSVRPMVLTAPQFEVVSSELRQVSRDFASS